MQDMWMYKTEYNLTSIWQSETYKMEYTGENLASVHVWLCINDTISLYFMQCLPQQEIAAAAFTVDERERERELVFECVLLLVDRERDLKLRCPVEMEYK